MNDAQGNACPVLHCRFDLAGAGPTDVYAKLVDAATQQGTIMCLNEISGWLLARSSGLPVAESAFLAYIKASELPPFHAGALPATLANGTYLFFCSQEISRTQATGIIETDELLEEQAHWPHAHSTIALDECTGNADRHLGNLVRKAHQDFALIDHGRLLFRGIEPCWQGDELAGLLDHTFDNLLHYNLVSAQPWHLDFAVQNMLQFGESAQATSCQRWGSNSSIWLLRCPGRRVSTSLR